MVAKASLTFAVLIIAAGATIALPQSSTGGPQFEVASVRPATPLGPMGMLADQKGGPGTGDPSVFTCRNCSLYWILADAFNIHAWNFSGQDWLQNTRFDFFAKIPAGATKEDFQKMVANLLTERFKMSLHREMRQMELYEMTAAKNGPKFRASIPKAPPANDNSAQPLRRDPDGFPVLPPGTSMAIVPGHARVRSEDRTMAWFADILSNQLRSPVRDATGLTGTYDFVLSWSWDEGPDAMTNFHTDLVDQLSAQLGLRLEQKKGPVEVLILDHMEKVPTAN